MYEILNYRQKNLLLYVIGLIASHIEGYGNKDTIKIIPLILFGFLKGTWILHSGWSSA